MYTNYAYGVQNQTGTSSANYNLFVTGTNDYTGSTGFMIKNDTTLSGPNKKGTRIFQDNTDNAYLDFRTTATDGDKSFAFRLQDDASPSTFNNMLTLNKDTVADTSVYGASISGRVKASQFYVNQPDTRAPNTAGIYMGQNNSTTGYFNINKGTGSGGFNFQTFNADGVTNKTNLSLNGSGSVQIPYYSTVTTDSQDSETTAMVVFDSTGNLVRSYQQNQRFRSVETRLNNLEGTVVASVPVKVNEIIGRLNTLKIWNTQIAGLNISAPPAPFNPSPATTAAAVQVQLALSVSLTTAQDPAWQTSFINAVATNLGISPSRIVISSVSLTATVYSATYKHLTLQKAYTAAAAGSVYVNVVVNPDPAGTSSVTPTIAASIIIAKAQNPSSDLAAAVAATGAVVDTGYVPAQKPSATATPAPTQPPQTFSPLSIPGMLVWLDANDLTTFSPANITNNADITQWRDKSGNQNHCNPTIYANSPAMANPKYNETGQSGKKSVYLNRSKLVGTLSKTYQGQSLIVYVVMKQTDTGPSAVGRLMSFGVSGETDYQNLAYTGFTSAGVGSSYGYGSLRGWSPISRNAYVTSPNCLNVSTIATLIDNPNEHTIQINGGTSTNSAAAGGLPNNFNIVNYTVGGHTYPDDALMSGYLSEVLVFGGILSTDQKQQIEGYLASKWGLQSSLAANHPYKSNLPQMTTFSPISIPGCSLWLDASTLPTGTITSWNDMSGFGNHAGVKQGTNTVVASGLKSLNAVQFSGSNSMNGTFTANSTNVANCMTTFVVATGSKSGMTGTFGRIMSLHPASDATDWLPAATIPFFYVHTTGKLCVHHNSTEIGVDWTTDTPFIAQSSETYGTLSIGINGQLTPTTTANPGSTLNLNAYCVGGYNLDNTCNWNGKIMEVIYYNVLLTTAQIQQVEGYLAWKWGLVSNLPSAHPYKLSAPFSNYFSIKQLPNPLVWLDAKDASTLTLSGSNVTGWADKSGNGANASVVSAGSAVPTITANAIGTNQAVTFYNTSQYVSPTFMAAPYGTAYTGSSLQVFVVGMDKGSAEYGRIVSSYDNSSYRDNSPTGIASLGLAGASGSGLTTYRNNYSPSTVQAMTTNTAFIAQSYQIPGTNGNSINGSFSPSVSAAGTTLFSPLNIIGSGIGAGGGRGWNGYIGEVMVFGSAFTPQQITMIEGDLANKWSWASLLPTVHPYKSITPVAPQTLMGRKITFAALPTSTISIASDGIEVYSYPGGPNIINSGLTVTSSPSYNSTFTPDRWINNNNSGNEWIGYNTTGQYIQVDLGAMIPIYKIVLYNRAYCCGQGNNGAKIQICTDDGSVSYISNPLSDTSGSTTPSGGSTTFGSWTFYPPNKNWIGNA